MTTDPVPAAAVQIAAKAVNRYTHRPGKAAEDVVAALSGWLHDPARVAELEDQLHAAHREIVRLRGLLRGPADPRMLHLSPLIIPERSPMSRDAGAYAENHHGWVIQDNVED